jgi:hypothetical protein
LKGDQGQGEVRVFGSKHLSDGSIPRSEGSGEAEVASSLGARSVSSVLGDRKEEESHVEDEEEENKTDGMTEGSDEHKEGEDEPSKEVERDRGLQLLGVGAICFNDAKLGDEDDTVRKPETTVAAKGCSSKGISHRLLRNQWASIQGSVMGTKKRLTNSHMPAANWTIPP